MSVPLDLAALRHDYAAQGLRRVDLLVDPIAQFSKWFEEAAAAQIRDVNAMTLATVSADGAPDARVVLLKGVNADGFLFFTNYESAKGRQLAGNPRVALNLFWAQLERQIRINGRAEKMSQEESEAYFHSRPQGSQLGAWSSHQSEVIPDRAALEAQLAAATKKFADKVIPLPPHWGGYQVLPETIEFWQGRTNRLHDRFRYTRQAQGSWLIERLSP